MKITVCIGSSCHIKGSRLVVEGLRNLIEKHQLQEKVQLSGTFCMGNCQQGVCVGVESEVFSVSPDTVESFFTDTVLSRLS